MTEIKRGKSAEVPLLFNEEIIGLASVLLDENGDLRVNVAGPIDTDRFPKDLYELCAVINGKRAEEDVLGISVSLSPIAAIPWSTSENDSPPWGEITYKDVWSYFAKGGSYVTQRPEQDV